jgi:uncharacterized membrane protein YqaE (UPF0057 family)
MKKIFLLFVTASVLISTNTHAGYAVRKAPDSATIGQTSSSENNVVTYENSNFTANVSTADEELNMVTGKKSFFTKVADRLKEAVDISKGAYIVLAIIWFGWLAMGINDNFEGFDWIISLLLYILGWLPGVIYTLIRMKKYY